MWTQVRLAEEAGISPTTVSGIENGRISRPHFGTVRKLAVALKVEPEDLLPHPQRGGRPARLSLEWSMASQPLTRTVRRPRAPRRPGPRL